MATRHLKTRPDWDEQIRRGAKDIDARLVTDDIAGLEVGDVVQYPGVAARVRRIRFYPGVGDLLAYEDWHRIAPEAPGPDAVRKMLEDGHAETARRTGAVAIELEFHGDISQAREPSVRATPAIALPNSADQLLETCSQLLDRSEGAGAVLSCYADLSVKEGFDRQWRPRFLADVRRIRDTLEGESAKGLPEFDRLADVIKHSLGSVEREHVAGAAVFAATGWDEPVVALCDQPLVPRVVFGNEPYVVPLAAAAEELTEYLVAQTDTHRGRLYASTPARARLLEELDEAVPRKNRSSGQRWGKQQATIARHREDHILHYLRELAQHIELAWKAGHYLGLILLGEREVLAQLIELLPQGLAERVSYQAAHAWAGEQPAIPDYVQSAAEAAAAARQERLIEEIGSRLAEGFAIATAPQEVLEALRNGQVRELAIGVSSTMAASRCPNCRSIFAAQVELCPYCRTSCVRANLAQEVLQFALHHAVPYQFIGTQAAKAIPGDIAAILLRDTPQWAASTRAGARVEA